LAKVRQDLEDRLAAEEERHRSQVAALEEQLEGIRMRQESEARLYGERLKELEQEKATDKKAAEEELERRLAEAEEEKSRLEYRIAELEVDLEESGTVEAELREALLESQTREEAWQQEDEQVERALEDLEERLKEADAARLLAEERAADLEAYLREAGEENHRCSEELQKALEYIRKISEPEQRLRAGINLFNASEHTRTVASISKAFGLPKVHVGSDSGPDSPSKPVITFVWEDITWRRYVSDPTEGVEEPRVYLVETGDDSSEIPDRKPNARMDAQGHLTLGVQAY
jgi:chromosome segregation ATPase